MEDRTSSLPDPLWRSLDATRKIADCGLFIIVTATSSSQAIPFDCPVCYVRLSMSIDIESFIEFLCCDSCSIRWARSRKNEWIDGWRPSDEQLDAAYENRRGYKKLCHI